MKRKQLLIIYFILYVFILILIFLKKNNIQIFKNSKRTPTFQIINNNSINDNYIYKRLNDKNSDEIIRKLTINNNILVTLFTDNTFFYMWNFIITEYPLFEGINLILISLDKSGYRKMINIYKNILLFGENETYPKKLDYGTPLYWSVVYKKTEVVNLMLKKGFNVMLIDNDIHFFVNPVPYFIKYNEDLVTACEGDENWMNSGL